MKLLNPLDIRPQPVSFSDFNEKTLARVRALKYYLRTRKLFYAGRSKAFKPVKFPALAQVSFQPKTLMRVWSLKYRLKLKMLFEGQGEKAFKPLNFSNSFQNAREGQTFKILSEDEKVFGRRTKRRF